MKLFPTYALSGLPGPLWLFGGYCVYQILKWTLQAVERTITFWPLHWPSALFWSLFCLLHGGVLFVMLRGLVVRKPYALAMSFLYAVFMLAQQLFVLVAGLVDRVDLPVGQAVVMYFSTLVPALFWIAAWLAYLCYVRRSKTLKRLFPFAERRLSMFVILLMAVLELDALWLSLDMAWMLHFAQAL